MSPFWNKKPVKKNINRVNRKSFWIKLRNIFNRNGKLTTTGQTHDFKRSNLSNIKRRINIFKRVSPRVIRITIFAIAFFIFSLLVLALVSLVRNPYYSISEINFIGNNSIPNEKFLNELSEYKGQSIFLINTGQVEAKIKKSFPNLYLVAVKKIFPNKIFIKITETEPKLIIINLNGAYLLDENSKIIDILTQEKINYDSDRLEIATDIADENSPLIKEIFIKKFLEDNKYTLLEQAQQKEKIEKEFNFDLIKYEDKFKEYKKLKEEILGEIDALTGKILSKIEINDYNFLPQIIFLDNTQFNKDAVIDKGRLILTLELVKYFSDINNQEHIVGHIEWHGKMLVYLRLKSGVKIIFGALKKPSEQLEDYEIMTNYLREQNMNYSQIDLSSKKISVK